ncbi:protein slowmo homolog isoform X3 [Durio zibethinus]|uniref:Protein slowmo homolog isoform X3 n=1 Tax=Durio zibethinus TaxID=66656 RepID=A0A6P5ZPH6_DURZI|nr:protein slowmo homolog isoform X3 [Durio zibethinus]
MLQTFLKIFCGVSLYRSFSVRIRKIVMVKAYAQEHVYKHPWERVTSASWRKFADPENKRTLSHILEVDTLNHKLEPLSVVDAQSKSMQLTTRNVSLQKFIEVEEKIRYDPHPDNLTGWTICEQETSIRIKPLSALASMAEKVEQRCAERFMQNSVKGREVMERICKYLEAEFSWMAP